MWCYPFPIYISGIKFLVWLHYWSCFQHSDKSCYCFLYIQFYKLVWLWFYVDFFLNLRFYYNAVEYRLKYLKMQHISIRKTPCFIEYATASSEEPQSATLGLRVLVQSAKLAFVSIYALCPCVLFIADMNPRSLAFPVVWK